MPLKLNRLTKKKDFERVFEKGKSFKEDFLVLKIVPNDFQTSQFGFIISQKVSKKAVVRNKIRRELKELMRLKIDKIKKGIDGVFMVLPGLEKKDFWEIETVLNNLLKKAKLIRQ